MSQIDPLREFTPRAADKGTNERADEPSDIKIDGGGLAAIRSFFEDVAVTNIYSKENVGSESYTIPGLPCHGGYDDLDREDK